MDLTFLTLTFSAGAVPLMILFLLLYGFCLRAGMGNLSLLAKCGGSFVSAFTAFFLLMVQGTSPLSSLLFWGLLLCVAADALLDIRFFFGVVAFGIAHILFIIRLFSLTQPNLFTLVVWVLLYSLTLLLFRKDLRKARNPILFLYPAVLTGMTSLALTLPFTYGVAALPTVIGSVLFTFSDFLVGKSFFDKNPHHGGAIIMSTYYGALYLFAVNALLGVAV